MPRLAPLLLLACSACPKHAIPTRYEVPAGFTGKLAVELGVPTAAPLPMDGDRRVVHFDTHAYVATSDPLSVGIVDVQFVRIDAAGKRTPLKFVACAGVSCKLADGEATLLGTANITTNGSRPRDVEFGAIGPCDVGFDAPPLP